MTTWTEGTSGKAESRFYLVFVVPGAPISLKRGRFVRATGHVYEPKDSAEYKALVRLTAMDALAGQPMCTGPVSLTLRIEMMIPQSWSAKKQERAVSGVLRPTTKPDCSNILKGIEDALNRVVWRDDSQIVELAITKLYSTWPRIEVEVKEI